MIGSKPHLTKYQQDILFSDARFTLTVACTKAGKTHSHILWLFGKAMEYDTAIGFNYWWIAPVYNQAKIAFKRMKRNLLKYGVFKFNETSLIILCPNGAEIHFKSAEKPDNLYGEDVYAAVFDEAPRAREESWHALRSTLTATEAPCKLIGNYGGISNWVSKLMTKNSNNPNYQMFKITCWDAIAEGILSEEEVLQAKKDLPAKIFTELYEAEASEDEGQLINNESIKKIFSNTHIQPGEKVITADVARLGNDKTVIAVWDGLRVIELHEIAISGVDDTVNKIKTLQAKYNVNMNRTVIDQDGVGGGVVDYLKGSIGFVNGGKPVKVSGKSENFANLKSQCYWKLSELVNKNQIYIDCNHDQEIQISQELEWVRLAKELDVSKINMMSKDEVKKKIGRSPDYSDALMMRMYFEVNPNKGKYFIY